MSCRRAMNAFRIVSPRVGHTLRSSLSASPGMATTSDARRGDTRHDGRAPRQVRDVAREVALLVGFQELRRIAGRVVDLDGSGLEDEERKVTVTDLEKNVPWRKMQPGRFGAFGNFGNLFGRQLRKRNGIEVQFVHV